MICKQILNRDADIIQWTNFIFKKQIFRQNVLVKMVCRITVCDFQIPIKRATLFNVQAISSYCDFIR